MKQNQVHLKEASSKEEIPFELSSLNQKLEVSTHSQFLCSEDSVLEKWAWSPGAWHPVWPFRAPCTSGT